jgi:hypothetical protein
MPAHNTLVGASLHGSRVTRYANAAALASVTPSIAGDLVQAIDTGALYYSNSTTMGDFSPVPTGGGGGFTPTKYTVSYASIAAAGAVTSFNFNLFSLPAKTAIHAVVIKHTTAFSGTGITGYTVGVGLATNPTKYASAFDVFQAVASNTFQETNDGISVEDFTSATPVILSATSVGANLNAGSGAGSVDIYIYTSTLP